jgi:hypothetical protein
LRDTVSGLARQKVKRELSVTVSGIREIALRLSRRGSRALPARR